MRYAPNDGSSNTIGDDYIEKLVMWYDRPEITIDDLNPGTSYVIEVTPFRNENGNRKFGPPKYIDVKTRN